MASKALWGFQQPHWDQAFRSDAVQNPILRKLFWTRVIVDVETSILNGKLVKSQKDDPRGTRHIVRGVGPDRKAHIGTVGRFTETDRYLLITVYTVMEI